MWDMLSVPWQVAFTEAWESYCNGSIPIGAVLIDSLGNIISQERNRINETMAPDGHTCSNRLAHAEINVLIQCAIVMSGIRQVRYAASDPVAGGSNLNNANNDFIRSRKIDIQCGENC